ncbi:hypothetical protein Sliba_73260 [Streptomyces nigrescens]|uniref:Uncharacterized protein n=1 Tax=Streptomyces nigrescens TaxID=1920 RepID=A0A640TS93_STRNI|nr:hypothetical protein Sliba_73260 [Streptomyces libani subsp. libani]GGW01779.1 hypothetical protein GCM10010500_57750 [Streptomyces libani subsp. libani]
MESADSDPFINRTPYAKRHRLAFTVPQRRAPKGGPKATSRGTPRRGGRSFRTALSRASAAVRDRLPQAFGGGSRNPIPRCFGALAAPPGHRGKAQRTR